MKKLAALILAVSFVGFASAQGSRPEYAAIDAAVRALPKPANLGALAQSLGSLAAGERERVRAVYIWMTDNIKYDVASFLAGKYRSTAPEDVFRYGNSICQGYSQLFAELCSRLGIGDVVVISGYAKAYSYVQGEKFTDTDHAWNAVKLEGAWHFFDSTWGAGSVNGRSFEKDYGEVWFNTYPELFRINHLPEDPAWQLCADTLSLEEYEAAPLLETYRLEALHDLGIAASSIVALYKRGLLPVTAYSFSGFDINVLLCPLDSSLNAGTEYSFELRAPAISSAALISNDNWIWLKKEGDVFAGRIRPAKGDLSLNMEIVYKGRKSYWGVLEYKVR